MTKTFKILPDLTCHELAGYKLPPVERHPIAIEVEMVEARSESFTINGCDSFTEVGCIKQVCTCYDFIPATNPDGTVKGRWVYE